MTGCCVAGSNSRTLDIYSAMQSPSILAESVCCDCHIPFIQMKRSNFLKRASRTSQENKLQAGKSLHPASTSALEVLQLWV